MFSRNTPTRLGKYIPRVGVTYLRTQDPNRKLQRTRVLRLSAYAPEQGDHLQAYNQTINGLGLDVLDKVSSGVEKFTQSAGKVAENISPIVNLWQQFQGKNSQPLTPPPQPQQQSQPQPFILPPAPPVPAAPPQNNTALYVGIGAAAVVGLGAIFLLSGKRR